MINTLFHLSKSRSFSFLYSGISKGCAIDYIFSSPSVTREVAEWFEASVEDGLFEFTPYTQDMASFYAKVDLLLMPSRYEGFPNVLLESISMGCTVLISSFGQNFTPSAQSPFSVLPLGMIQSFSPGIV